MYRYYIREYKLRLCIACYMKMGQPEIYEPRTSWHSIWVMTPEWSNYKLNCAECGDRLFKLKRAYILANTVQLFILLYHRHFILYHL